MDTITITAERPVSWRPTAEMPTILYLNVRAQAHTSETGLVLEVEITTLAERTVERWHLCFHGCAAFRQEPVGNPGNPRLLRFDWSRQLAPQPNALWVIEGSAWLPECGTAEIDSKSLQHFVVYEADRSRVWHIAACRGDARRLEPGERLGVAVERQLGEAMSVAR